MNKPTDEPEFPERLYLERWPDWVSRDDRVFYEPTGAGIDMRTGAESTVAMYVRSSKDDIAHGWGEAIEALRELVTECASMRYREFDRADALRVAASELERLAEERGHG